MELSKNMRVRDLKRKDRIGTVFFVEAYTTPEELAERARLKRGPAMRGYATLKSRAKNGTVTATMQATGEDFTFQASDTMVWPKAAA